MPLPRCFFDISINGVPSGRIIFELFKNECPKTVENFRCLCTGEKGEGRTTFKPLHYEGTPIHRIVKGFIIQGGDFSNGDGTGGESIYGGMFKDESFKYKHDQPFLLSMANKGPNTNGSQFFITTRPAPHLDSIHVVFGRVVDGTQFVVEMENQKVDANHRPYADVRITRCGELVLLKKGKPKKPRVSISSTGESSEEDSSSSEESESESETDSEEERRRRRRRRKKRLKKKEALLKERMRKKRKKEKAREKSKEVDGEKKREKPDRKKRAKRRKEESESSDSGSKSDDSNTENEPVSSTVPELAREEIPPEIKSDRTSWLYRRSRTPSPKMESDKKKRKVVTTRQTAPDYSTIFKSRKNEVSRSGRKLKGRGNMRYRTPPRFGDGNDDDDLRSELRSTQSYQDTRRDGRRPWSPFQRQQRRSRSRSRSREQNYNQHDNRRGHNERSPPRYRRYDRPMPPPREGRRRRFEERDSRRQDSPNGETRYERERGNTRRSPLQDWKKEEPRSMGDGGGGRIVQEEGSIPASREGKGSRWDKDPSQWAKGHPLGPMKDSRSKSRERESERRDHSHRRHREARSRSRSASLSSNSSGSLERSQNHRRRDKSGYGGSDRMQSKWSRHHDDRRGNNDGGSTSEEDRELERTYQQKEQADEEDVFGLNKILS